mgnify:FL=1
MMPDYAFDTYNDEGGAKNLIDFRAIGDALARRKWSALTAVVIVLAAVASIFLFSDKRFDAVALVGLEREPERIINTPGDGSSNVLIDMPSVDTEVTILLSPEVVRRSVETLSLIHI